MVRSVFRQLILMLLILASGVVFAQGKSSGSQTIIDANGQRQEFEKPFTRIISLYSAHTENLCSLGAEKQLVSISQSDDFPPEILNKQRLSYREDPEKFIAMRPDLVLVRPMIERSYPELVNKLRLAKIRVISLQPRGIDEMFAYWRALARLSGKEENGEKMIREFNDRLKRVEISVARIKKDQRPRVYFESIHSKSKTFAPKSIAIFALEQAGGVNIASDAVQIRRTNIAYFAKERLLEKGAEVDVYLAQRGRMNPVSVDIILNEPGYGAIRAVGQGRVYLIEEQLVSRPTMRLAEGIEQLHGLLYPEAVQTQ
jgi:iron complex transport system substrate-binding protein